MSGEKKINILFTSVGRRSYLVEYFKEVLGNRGEIFVANSSNISPAFKVADHSVVTPLIYDDKYIPFLLNYCIENKIGTIISLFDIDLPILSKNKNMFKDYGIQVIVSDPEIIEICNDKWKTYEFLIHNGFDTSKTFINIDDALDSINDGIIQYPVIVKPRWGMGSIAIFEADNEEELRVFYKKIQRNIPKTYLKYESSVDIENSVLIQEKLCGQEHGLDIINNLDGEYQNTICKIKYAMRSGETDCAVTSDNEVLIKIGKKLSRLLHHIGNLDCDVFMVGNKPYILELNARFGGGYPFSHMSGVNLPKAIVDWIAGVTPNDECFISKTGVMSQKDIRMVLL